jgi:hypothetical protein
MSAVGLEIMLNLVIGSLGGMWIDFFKRAILLKLGAIFLEGKVEFRMRLAWGWVFVGRFGR